MTSAREALERLQAGNRRFASGASAPDTSRHPDSIAGKKAFAAILGCVDSRVPPELVFDQGLADLFVVRVAGNIATPTEIGSLELAVHLAGLRLVVVLGHSDCLAIAGAVNELRSPSDQTTDGMRSIFQQIQPAVEGLRDAGTDQGALPAETVRANVRLVSERLRQESRLLASAIQDDGLLIVGAEYSVKTGAVDFFDTPS